MQDFSANITKRTVKSKHRDGRVTEHFRYFLNYNDPATGKRVVRRFSLLKEAQAVQQDLYLNSTAMARRRAQPPTVGEAVEYWLKSRKGQVQDHTYKAYLQLGEQWIVGPAYEGTAEARRQIGITKRLPKGVKAVQMLGKDTPIEELRTADIRKWLMTVQDMSTPYVAKTVRKALSAIFRLIEEDFDIRLARMPTRVGQPYRRKFRQLLTDEQVQLVIDEAKRDPKWGIYYAFGFFMGTRPSEQLGLLWEDVDLVKGRVLIHRTQLRDGSLKEFTKTDAGMREIPMNSILLEMMREWHERCPRLDGKLHRVFPAQSNEQLRGRRPLEGSDGGLTLSNYHNRVWHPMLKRLGLPKITPYAARHMVISFLQAQGVEIGLVAKIAGHANPQVTLTYYTHAVREYDGMMDELNAAYGLKDGVADSKTGVQI